LINGSNASRDSQIINALTLAIQLLSLNATVLLVRQLNSCGMVVTTSFKPANYGTLTSTKAKLETNSTTTITLLAALVVTKLFRLQIDLNITTKVSTLLSI
jgi:hypothetical protein